MNVVILSGRLVADPDMRYTSGEKSTAIGKFRIAVDRERKDGVDFFDCTTFGKTAEFVEKYFKKGLRVELSGRVENDNYTNKKGEKVYTVKILADRVGFGESKKSSESEKEEEKGEEVAPAVPDGFVQVPNDVAESSLPFV